MLVKDRFNSKHGKVPSKNNLNKVEAYFSLTFSLKVGGPNPASFLYLIKYPSDRDSFYFAILSNAMLNPRVVSWSSVAA